MGFVIIGASAAGLTAAQTLRAHSDLPISIITDEPEPGYARCLLPDVLAGTRTLADIRWRGEDFYRKHNLTLMAGTRVVQLDQANRQIILADGQVIGYRQLLVATGSSPTRPAGPGAGAQGVFTLRTYRETMAMAQMAHQARHAVITGGGLVGLKAAWALRRLGVQQVTVLVKSPHLLVRQLDEESAAMLGREFRAAGIDCIFGVGPLYFGQDHVHGPVQAIGLDDGRELPADMVLVGKGVSPNTGLVRDAGGAAGKGIKVDDYLATTLPGVFAAGDCIELRDLLTGGVTPSGLWPLAVEQGRCAALNMLGRGRKYPPPVTRFNAVQFGDLPLVSVGLVDGGDNVGDCSVYVSRSPGVYRKLVFRGDQLIGFIMLGRIEQAGVYHAVVKKAAPVPGALKDKLIQGTVCAADIMKI